VTRRTLAPGTVFTRACEGEEVTAVLSGLVRITLEAESAILGAGDSVRLLPGTTHQAEVLGSSAVVMLRDAS
jgi:quercetin dioxygenase-like cupin family protein